MLQNQNILFLSNILNINNLYYCTDSIRKWTKEETFHKAKR